MPCVECGRFERCNRPAISRCQPLPLSPFKGVQIDAFVLQRPPKTLDHPIVDPAPFTIHADLDLRIRQHVDPIATGELAALIEC